MRSSRRPAGAPPTVRWHAADDVPHVPTVKRRGSCSCAPLRSGVVTRLLAVSAIFFTVSRALQLSLSSSAYLSVADNATLPVGAVFRNARWADANGVLAQRCCEHGVGTRRLRAARSEQRTLCTCIDELMSDQLGALQPEPMHAAITVSQAILWSVAPVPTPTAKEAPAWLMRLRDVRFVLGSAAEAAAFGPRLRPASCGLLMVGDDNVRQLAQAVDAMLSGTALSASHGIRSDNVSIYSSQLVGSIWKPDSGFRCQGSDCVAEATALRHNFDRARSSFADARGGVGSAGASEPMVVVFGGHLKALILCSDELPLHARNTTGAPLLAAFRRLAQDAVERAVRTLTAACGDCFFVWRLEQGTAPRSEVSTGCVALGLAERSARWNAVVRRTIEASPMRGQWRIFDPAQSTSAMADDVESSGRCCSAARVLTAQQLLLSIGAWREERNTAAWAGTRREIDLALEERFAAERMRSQRRVADFPHGATAAGPRAAPGIERLRRRAGRIWNGTKRAKSLPMMKS